MFFLPVVEKIIFGGLCFIFWCLCHSLVGIGPKKGPAIGPGVPADGIWDLGWWSYLTIDGVPFDHMGWCHLTSSVGTF